MTTAADIDKKLDKILAILEARPAAKAPLAMVAADADIDDPKYGDPTVFKDPKFWTGEKYAGTPYSKCPADYLLVLAKDLEGLAAWLDEQGDPQMVKRAGYSRKDAAKARAWAARIGAAPAPKKPQMRESTFKAAPKAADADPEDGDAIPF